MQSFIITKSLLEELCDANYKLIALEEAGVDRWDGYEEALNRTTDGRDTFPSYYEFLSQPMEYKTNFGGRIIPGPEVVNGRKNGLSQIVEKLHICNNLTGWKIAEVIPFDDFNNKYLKKHPTDFELRHIVYSILHDYCHALFGVKPEHWKWQEALQIIVRDIVTNYDMWEITDTDGNRLIDEMNELLTCKILGDALCNEREAIKTAEIIKEREG